MRLGLEARKPALSTVQFMALTTLRFLSPGNRRTGGFAPSLCLFMPLNIVTAIGKSVPIVPACRLSRNGAKTPAAADFDLFNDVDAGHKGILNHFQNMDSIMDSMAVTH